MLGILPDEEAGPGWEEAQGAWLVWRESANQAERQRVRTGEWPVYAALMRGLRLSRVLEALLVSELHPTPRTHLLGLLTQERDDVVELLGQFALTEAR